MKKLLFLVLLNQIIIAQNWVSVIPKFYPEGNYNLYLSSFVDENNGWFVDIDTGGFFHTSDGGYNWYLQINGNLSLKIYPKDIYFSDKNNGWILATVSGSTILFKTNDTGINWQLYNVPSFSKIYFFDKDNGLGAGLEGIYYSTDGGLNWSKSKYDEFSPSIGSVSKIFFLDKLNGFIACMQSGWSEGAGYFFQTSDGGKSWKKNLTDPPHDIADIFFFDLKKGLCAAGLVGFWKTEDGGNSWIKISSEPTFDLLFLNEKEGWATNIFSGIIYTADSGRSWRTAESTTFNFGKFHYRKGMNKVFVTGLSNKIFFLDNIVSITAEPNLSIGKDFSLSQNYPNPFNPTTIIKYTIPFVETQHAASQLVTLKVYNVLGKEVAILVNEVKPPGNYEIRFNAETLHATSLPSGIYFYTIKVGNFSSTKKMVLLK